MRVDALNDRFGLPGMVWFEQGNGELVRAAIHTPSASGHVYLHGAHVTHYQPADAVPALFTSARSHFAPGRAIRGGVPVIFPWFGPHPTDSQAPDHGFARILEWSVEAVEPSDAAVSLVFGLSSSLTTQATWPYAFGLRYRVTFGPRLDLVLEVENRAAEAATFQEALHTYCRVGDVEQVTVYGLDAVTYIDKAAGMQRKVDAPGGTRIRGLTDRVYVNTRAQCVLDDPALGRRLLVEKDGSDSTVLWNPGRDISRTMADLGAEEWRSLLCVETANAGDNAVRLAPGQRHRMQARISVGGREGSRAA